MASLQGHQEWRRLFPDAPTPKKDGEVIKNYPWVPILSEEAFAAHHQRVKRLLSEMPEADSIFVNDLQGGPSACGCGNTLCRWTADYGPIKTVNPLGADAAARFIETISKLAPNSEVIPVWLTECEEHDGADDGLCAGVGCFRGICWKAWTDQLMPVAENSATIAAFLPFRELQRDIPLYGDTAAWIPFALGTFRTMPLQHQKSPVAAGRLIAVLQGWDVSPAEIEAQKRQVQRAGAAGCVVVRDRIDQSWQPRLYRLPE
jgi:hypothetical protein